MWQAEPLEGGQLVAAGRMWISPDAENDARAVRMQLQGRGLPAEALLQRYLPEVSSCYASATWHGFSAFAALLL